LCAVEGLQPRFFVAALRAPLNQGVLDELRTADRVGVALSVIRRGRRPCARWTLTDRTLHVALTRLDATTCPGCGLPVDEAWGSNHEHQVDGKVCSGCAALEKDAKKEHPAGWKAFIRKGIERGRSRFGPGA